MSETNNHEFQDEPDVSAGVLEESPGTDQADEIEKLKARLAEAEAKNATVSEPDELSIEREVRKGFQKGELAGHVVMVPPLAQWKSSAMKALNAGDFETWAERTLDDEGWDIWQDVDPSLDEIDEFFGTFDLGVGRGNSRGSRRSSRNARTR